MPTSNHPTSTAFRNLAALAIICGLTLTANSQTFTTVTDPAATMGINLAGISGGSVAGSFYNASYVSQGFIYNGSSFTSVNDPNGSGGTSVGGFSSGVVMGSYIDSSYNVHGFTYSSGSGYTTLDDPSGVNGTYINGSSGTNFVGSYADASYDYNGFLYNGTSWTTLDDPLGVGGTQILGISGNDMVGYYIDSSFQTHAFLYNGSTWTTLDFGSDQSRANGIDGNYIVGTYYPGSSADGFVYDIATGDYTTINDPDAGPGGTLLTGIDGDTLAGNYLDDSYDSQGFITTLPAPEPGTLMLGGLGAAGLCFFRRRK